MKKTLLLFTLIVLCPLQAEDAPIIYLNDSAQQMDIDADPNDSWGRRQMSEVDLSRGQLKLLEALKPLIKTFPYAVYHDGELYYKSDDNCTVIGEKLFSKNITKACRIHDYCYLGLRDYSEGHTFREKLTQCNDVFKEDLFQVCETTRVAGICKAVAQIIKLTVEKVPLSFRVFVSGQNKQVLFLSQAQRIIEADPELDKLNREIGFFDIQEFQRKMKSFCFQQDLFMDKYRRRKLYITYGSWDKRVLIPNVKFPDCIEENGNLFVGSPHNLQTN
jgi:hypothetical protein